MGLTALGHQPPPELGERSRLVSGRQRVPGGERAVHHGPVGVDVVGEQGPPQVGAVLAERLHVDVHLDVGARNLRPLVPADERGVGQPGDRVDDRVVECHVAGPVHRCGATVMGELIDRGQADLGQRIGLVSGGDEADVAAFGQFRSASAPPHAAAAFADPARRGDQSACRDGLTPLEHRAVVVEQRLHAMYDDAVGVEADHPGPQLLLVVGGRQPGVEQHVGQLRQS